jgi:hypothetical protein
MHKAPLSPKLTLHRIAGRLGNLRNPFLVNKAMPAGTTGTKSR